MRLTIYYYLFTMKAGNCYVKQGSSKVVVTTTAYLEIQNITDSIKFQKVVVR